jgi:hypothetical protein
MSPSLYFRNFSFLVFGIFLLISCRRDDNSGLNPSVDDKTEVQAGVSGIVIDEKGLAVEGAQVKCGSSTTTTDRYGIFRFNSISISKNNGFVKVEKIGFFKAYRNFVASAGRLNQVRIRLLPKAVNVTITSGAGGSVTLPDGAKMTLPANAVTDLSGNAYTGPVSVSMTWINPTDPNLPDVVMGDLRGITTGGEERGLETFGMIGVELKGSSGQDLKVKSGQKADLSFPIPASLASNAPATIDLWHYDETKARWVQEGKATKSGTNYIAQVSHFSFWNCDAPFPLIEFCAKLVDDATGKPLNNLGVKIVRPNGSSAYGRTDSSGNICGKIPKNESLVLQVLNPCNESSGSVNIGPFTSNTSLGLIKVNVPTVNKVVVTGTVTDCNNVPLANGVVSVYAPGGQSYSATVVNGVYELTFIKCNNQSVNYSVTAVDLTALQQNVPVSVTITSGSVTVPPIQSCGTSSLQFIEILIDGTPYNLVAPPDRISIMDSATFSTNNRFTISGGKTNSPGSTTSNSVNFSTIHNRTAANGLPLSRCFVFVSQLLFSEQILTPNPTINLTKYSLSPGGVVEGNFTISMNFQGTPRTVKCSFRVLQK